MIKLHEIDLRTVKPVDGLAIVLARNRSSRAHLAEMLEIAPSHLSQIVRYLNGDRSRRARPPSTEIVAAVLDLTGVDLGPTD